MPFAWYGHLKFRGSPLWMAVLASWCIALGALLIFKGPLG